MSGGPSTNTSTSQVVDRLPKNLRPYALELIQQGAGEYLPGGSPAQLPASAQQQVAPFTPDQLAAMGQISGQTGTATSLADVGAGGLSKTLSGDYLNPATNPYLTDTYNEAAKGVTTNYENAVAPSNIAAAQGAGGLGSSAFAETTAENQFGLGQNLNDLATNIYGGNYANERANMMNAQGLIGQTQSDLYAPANQLLASGSLQQQQQQTGLDTTFQNALRAINFPMQALSGFGNLLGQAAGNAGTQSSVSIGPNSQASK
jgi:hypothetical protein